MFNTYIYTYSALQMHERPCGALAFLYERALRRNI